MAATVTRTAPRLLASAPTRAAAALFTAAAPPTTTARVAIAPPLPRAAVVAALRAALHPPSAGEPRERTQRPALTAQPAPQISARCALDADAR